MYRAIRINLPKNSEVKQISRTAGRIYSKTISLIRKIHEKKDFWLSQGAIQKYGEESEMAKVSNLWKKEELTVAKEFLTRRQLMKGTDEKNDIIHDLFQVDVKVRKRWDILKWFQELKESAENKIPILVVRKPRMSYRLAVVDFDFLVSLLKGAGLLKEESNE